MFQHLRVELKIKGNVFFFFKIWYNIETKGERIMELYTKESLKEVIEKSKDEFYMPKALFDHYKNLRLETKLAYVSILETMKNKAVYTTENLAYVKVDNPQIQANLAELANKEVDQEKVNKISLFMMFYHDQLSC